MGYDREKYHERRTLAFEMLGGERCASCRSEKSLEFDHIDPATKEVSASRWHKVSCARFVREVLKCQVLCFTCHRKKTLPERGHIPGGAGCGTISRYTRGCRCDECRAAMSAYRRAYYERVGK